MLRLWLSRVDISELAIFCPRISIRADRNFPGCLSILYKGQELLPTILRQIFDMRFVKAYSVYILHLLQAKPLTAQKFYISTPQLHNPSHAQNGACTESPRNTIGQQGRANGIAVDQIFVRHDTEQAHNSCSLRDRSEDLMY